MRGLSMRDVVDERCLKILRRLGRTGPSDTRVPSRTEDLVEAVVVRGPRSVQDGKDICNELDVHGGHLRVASGCRRLGGR